MSASGQSQNTRSFRIVIEELEETGLPKFMERRRKVGAKSWRPLKQNENQFGKRRLSLMSPFSLHSFRASSTNRTGPVVPA